MILTRKLAIAVAAWLVSNTIAAPCTFCTRGDISTPKKLVTIPGYEFLDSCATLDALLPAFLQDDASECQLLQSMSTYCGCPPPQDSCSMCPDGKPVSEPEKEVPWLAGAFQGIVPSCGLVEAYAASLPSDDGTCTSLQAISSHCGCAPIESHCVYCPGETLQEEYKNVEFPKLSNEAMGITGTCELFFLTQYQVAEDSELCMLSELFTFNCGCNNGVLGYYGISTEMQQKVVEWLPRAIASLSLIASMLVFRDIWRSKKKHESVYHQLVFLIACFDTVTSCVWIVGTAAIETYHARVGLDWGIHGAHGNEATCTAQGFFFQLGFTSLFLSLSLTIYYLLVIVYGYREQRLKKIRVWLFGSPLLLGFGLAFAVIPFVDVGWSSCQFDVYPRSEFLWSLLLFGLFPILGSTFAIIIILVVIYLKVKAQMSRSERWRFSRHQSSVATQQSSAVKSMRQRLEKDVFLQCISYACAFCASWPILALAEIQATNFDFPYWFWILVCILAPLQGFNNAICYFRPFRRVSSNKLNGSNPRRRGTGHKSRSSIASNGMPGSSSSFFLKHARKYSIYLRPSLIRSSVLDRSGELEEEQEEERDPTVALANLEPGFEHATGEEEAVSASKSRSRSLSARDRPHLDVILDDSQGYNEHQDAETASCTKNQTTDFDESGGSSNAAATTTKRVKNLYNSMPIPA